MSDLLDPGELPEAAVFIDKVPDFVERFRGGVRAFDDGSGVLDGHQSAGALIGDVQDLRPHRDNRCVPRSTTLGDVRFELLELRLPHVARRILHLVQRVAALILYGVMTFAGLQVMPFAEPQVFPTIPISLVWLYLPVVFAGVLLLVQTLASIAISAATARSASTNLPSTSSFSAAGSIVRRPSVCAALAMDSTTGCTRT